MSLKKSKKQEAKIKIRLVKLFALASVTMSSSLDKCYMFRSVSKNKRTCFNFLLLSEKRHSHVGCPTSNKCTMLVYLNCSGDGVYSEYPILNNQVSYSECPTLYNRASYSECPILCKYALLRIDTIQGPTSYKNLTPEVINETCCGQR